MTPGRTSVALSLAPLAAFLAGRSGLLGNEPFPLTTIAFSLLFVQAMIGWGGVVTRALGLETSWVTRFAAGLSATGVLGGVVSLMGALSGSFLALIALAGLVAFTIEIVRGRDGPFALKVESWMWLILPLLAAKYLQSMYLEFNVHDDYQGYFAFIAKMLHGGLSEDPFSGRRLLSSLGSWYFPAALFASQTGFQHLHVLDAGIGPLLICAQLLASPSLKSIPGSGKVMLVAIVTLIPAPVVNIMPLYAGTLLTLCTWQLITERAADQGQTKHSLARGPLTLIGLLLSSLSTMRNNFIPIALFLVAAFAVMSIVERRRTPRELALAMAWIAACWAVFMLPWMIGLKLSSGTFLYRVLGTGYDGIQYGYFLSPTSEFLDPAHIAASLAELADYFFHRGMPLMILVCAVWLLLARAIGGKPAIDYRLGLAMAFGVCVPIAMFFASGNNDFARLSWSATFAVFLLAVARVIVLFFCRADAARSAK